MIHPIQLNVPTFCAPIALWLWGLMETHLCTSIRIKSYWSTCPILQLSIPRISLRFCIEKEKENILKNTWSLSADFINIERSEKYRKISNTFQYTIFTHTYKYIYILYSIFTISVISLYQSWPLWFSNLWKQCFAVTCLNKDCSPSE